ncbi:Rho GTPase activation protein [Chlamydoabsidia padenii]|nr:Rho GTPase activation protein [Chlamydoabsidia padenii]
MSMMDNQQSVKRQKSFRRWLKKVAAPKVAPLLPKGTEGKQHHQQQQQQQGVFGVPLVVSISYARGTVGYKDTDQVNHQNAAAVPLIVSKCGSYLKRNGLETEGIFRLSASTKRVNTLQQIFDSPMESYGLHHNWKDYTVHDAGSILRRYFIQLPDPVIPTSFYQPFRNVMTDDSMYKTTSQRIDAFQKLIRQLPTAHQHLLLYILDMLRFFAVNASITRMDASNLAAVFSPGLLSHPDHNTPVHYMISQRVIEFLIEYQNVFTMDLLVDDNDANEIASPVEPDEALVSPNIPRRSSCVSLPSPVDSIPPIPMGQLYEKSTNRHSMPPTPVSPTTTQSPMSTTGFESTSPSDQLKSHNNTRDIINVSPSDHKEKNNMDTPPPTSRALLRYTTLKYQYGASIINAWNQVSNLVIRRLDGWWKHVFNPLLLGWYLILGVITFTLVYEGYLICANLAIIEPCIFFSGFSGFWLLLVHGIPPLTLEQLDTCTDTLLDDNNTGDELSLFNDISLNGDTTDDQALLTDKEIMANWQQLMTRSWRAPPDDNYDDDDSKTLQQTYPALGHDSNIATDDEASMISMSSRFMEDDDNNNSIGYDDDDEEISLGSTTDEDLQHLWARYDQFKQDEALAEKLQQEEQELGLQLKKQGDAYNPFLQND